MTEAFRATTQSIERRSTISPRPPITGTLSAKSPTLTASDELVAALLDGNPAPVAILTPAGEIARTNRPFIQQFVLRAERLVGLPFAECLVPTSREPSERALSRLRKRESDREELDVYLRASDSHQPPVHLTLVPIGAGESYAGVVVTVRERIVPIPAATIPPVEDEYYQIMFASNPVPMYIFDVETLRFLDVNESMIRQYGYTREEFRSLTLKDIRPPDEVPRLLRSLDLFRDHHYPPTPWIHRHKDGTLFLMEVTTHVIRFAGRRCRLAMTQEVTQRIRAQHALEEREQTLRTIGDNLPGGAIYQAIVEPNGSRRFVHWSAGIERILGLCPAEILEDSRRIYSLVHSEDLPAMIAAEEDSIREQAPFDWEFRAFTTDGLVKYLHCRSAPRALDDGSVRWDGILFDVTQEKRNREALLASERQFSDLLENIQLVALICDGEGRLTYCNPFFEKLTGWPRSECLGLDFAETFIAEPDRAWIRSSVLATIRKGQFPRHFQTPILMRSGQSRMLSWNNSAVRDSSGNVVAMASIGEDITERLRSEEVLRDREKLLRALGDNLPGGAIYRYRRPVGTDGGYSYFSQGITRMCRFTPDDLTSGRVRFRDWMHPADQQRMAAIAVRSTETLEPISQEVRMKLPDGSEPIWQWRAVPFRLPDGEVGWDGIILDVTEQRRLESQVQQAQKFQTISVLAGGIAHDFNNLLTGILGFADLASMELPPDDPVRDYMLSIVQSSERAAELCQQMLAYAGQGRYLIGPIQLTKLVREMTRLLRTVISKKAELRFELDEKLPTFPGDITQIRQVILNLLTNASEALPETGGFIHLRTGVMWADREFFSSTVLSEQLPEGNYLYVEVQDTGCGMSNDTLKQIFDPFFTTKFKGRGLGLAALLGIVRAHHGSIRVISEPGNGSTFRIVFPIED